MPLLNQHLNLNLNYLPQTTMKYQCNVLGLTHQFWYERYLHAGVHPANHSKAPPTCTISRELQVHSYQKVTGDSPLKVFLLETTLCCRVEEHVSTAPLPFSSLESPPAISDAVLDTGGYNLLPSVSITTNWSPEVT